MFDHTTIRREHRRAIFAALMISTFMAAMEVTVIATVMPTVIGRLGGFELFSWAFSIYLLAQAVMTPVYGRLADLFGRKRTWIGSCLVFLAGSTLCGFAWSMPSLIAFRAIQGLGAGGMGPIASTIIADISAPKDRPRAVGYISAIWGIAAIVGPLIGALLVVLGWPLVFWINLPIGAISGLMVVLYLYDDRPAQRHALDLPGAGLLLLASGSLMLVLTQHDALSDRAIAGFTGFGALAFAVLVAQQRRAPEPLVPRHFWRNRIIVTGVAFGIASGAYMVGLTAFLPMYVQGVLGGPPFAAGSLVAYAMATWTLGVLALGRFVPRFTYRATALTGTALMILGSVGPLTLSESQAPFWIRLTLSMIGFGMGMSNLTFTVAVQAAVETHDRGRATSSYFFARILGQALGAAALGGVLNAGMLLHPVPGLGANGLVEALVDPMRRAALEAGQLATDAAQLDQALHGVFQAAWGLALVSLLLAAALPAGARLIAARDKSG